MLVASAEEAFSTRNGESPPDDFFLGCEGVWRCPPRTLLEDPTGYLKPIHPEDRERTYRAIVDRLAAGKPYCVEFRWIAPDGGLRWVLERGIPLGDSDDAAEQYIAIRTDITKPRLELIRHRDLVERMSLANEAAGIGFWEFDVPANQCRWNEAQLRLYGITAEEFDGTREAWRCRVHPGDVERAETDLASALTDGGRYTSQYRVIWPDGSVRIIRSAGVCHQDVDGRLVRVVGVSWEVPDEATARERLTAFKDELERKVQQRTQELGEKEAALRSMMDNLPHLTWLKDTEGRYLAMNRKFADFLRLADPGHGIGKTDLDLQPKEFAQKYRADDAEVMAGRRQIRVEERATDGDRGFWVETYKTPIIDAGGKVLGTTGIAIDITERKRAEEAMRIAAVAFDSELAMMITDADSVILNVNRAFTKTTGYSAQEIVGKTPRLLQSGRHDAEFYRQMWASILSTGGWRGEIWDRRKDGSLYPKWLTISAVKDDSGAITHYVGTHSDITEQKLTDEKIRKLAFYDALTGLPNRILLRDRLVQALALGQRNNSFGALMLIDLDNFKTLNDTLGHANGDLLLREVSRRLGTCVRESDTVARLGGDEFVIVLPSLDAAGKAEATGAIRPLIERIFSAFRMPFALGPTTHYCTASIGVTLFKGDDLSTDDLMKQADLAMYRSKDAGRDLVHFFDPSMESNVRQRASMEAELRQAILDEQLVLFYQAQVGSNGRTVGAEALLRWQHPLRGILPPMEFIPVAEETGLIAPLGHWVLERACRQLSAWAGKPRLAELVLSVNVSASELRRSEFLDHVSTVLDRTGANPQRLKLELTESVLVENAEEVAEKMAALKAMGVAFALDDFGTGYSSLSYLRRLPLDQLKIDRSLVHGVLTNPNDAAIARTVIALAQNLGLAVVAEGVETEAQRAFLEGSGCHCFQGYLFGMPLPAEAFEAMVMGS